MVFLPRENFISVLNGALTNVVPNYFLKSVLLDNLLQIAFQMEECTECSISFDVYLGQEKLVLNHLFPNLFIDGQLFEAD